MLLALLTFLSQATTPPPPTLGAISALPPEAAGEALLGDREHKRIETVERVPPQSMDLPGLVRLDLFEQPVEVSGGCTRQRWTATFRHARGSPESEAILSNARAVTEVALPHASGCSNASFVHVNPGMGAQEALDALAFLEDLRARRSAVHFSCLDETRSNLCRSDRHMRRELARLPASVVTKAGGQTDVWLGKPGQIGITVRYSDAERERVAIRRSIPAPF
ncbi:hypothetical protein [Allosphingosinicella deserti]|uniref:Uncharacterized protein n=1 Tax=Allosphingosinicella deserti TaxID=2116704 RepID=A0A2P7QFC4_9SPHN|nr:hypothetical protein [Sphingomonas deserti]PSJ36625.1 hypothetical protein C7I55_24840 [Sphingomonas deserti]